MSRFQDMLRQMDEKYGSGSTGSSKTGDGSSGSSDKSTRYQSLLAEMDAKYGGGTTVSGSTASASSGKPTRYQSLLAEMDAKYGGVQSGSVIAPAQGSSQKSVNSIPSGNIFANRPGYAALESDASLPGSGTNARAAFEAAMSAPDEQKEFGADSQWWQEHKKMYSSIAKSPEYQTYIQGVQQKESDIDAEIGELEDQLAQLGNQDKGFFLNLINGVDTMGMVQDRAAIEKKIQQLKEDSGRDDLSVRTEVEDLLHENRINLNYMTDDQWRMMGYLYNKYPDYTDRRKAILDYASYIAYDINAREQQSVSQWAQDLAGSWSLGEVRASEISLPTNLMSVAGYINAASQYLSNKAIGEDRPVDYYNPSMSMNTMTTSIRGTVAQNWNQAGTIQLDEKEHPLLSGIFNGKGLGDLYQLGMSMGDSVAVAALTKALGLPEEVGSALLGGSAATQGMLDALDRGATDGQALTIGFLNGAFEMLFEKYSIGELIKDVPSYTVKDVVKEALKQSGVEAWEEGMTTIGNTLADVLVMEDKSELETMIREYKLQGYSDAEAQALAAGRVVGDILMDAAGGFVSGGIMGGVYRGVQTNQANRMAGKQVLSSDTLSQMQDLASRLDSESLRESASAMTDSSGTGKIGAFAREVADTALQDIQNASTEAEATEAYRKTGNVSSDSFARSAFDLAYLDAAQKIGFFPDAFFGDTTDQQFGADGSQKAYESNSHDNSGVWEQTPGVNATTGAEADSGTGSESKNTGETASLEREHMRSLLKSGAVDAETAEWILKNPEFRKAFEAETGIKVTGTEEQQKNLVVNAAALYAERESIRNPNQANQVDNTIRKALKSSGEALGYSGDTLNGFVAGYRGNISTEEYQDAYNGFYTYGKIAAESKSVSFDQAVNSMSVYARRLGNSAAMAAFNRGKADALASATSTAARKPEKKSTGTFSDKTTSKKKRAGYGALTDTLEKFAKKTGIDVELVDSLKSGEYQANGRILLDTMTIQLSADADNPLAALGHEAGEYLLAYNPEGYAQVRDQILNWWVEHENANSIDALVKAYQERYQKAGQAGKTWNDAANEAVNDALGAMLTTDAGIERFVQWVQTESGLSKTEQKNLFQKIGDMIRSVIDGLKKLLEGSGDTAMQKRILEMEVNKQQEILDAFLEAVEGTNVTEARETSTEKSVERASLNVPESGASQEQQESWESVFNADSASREAYQNVMKEIETAEKTSRDMVQQVKDSGVLPAQVTFTDPDKTLVQLRKENQALRDRVEYWKGQTRRTKKGEFRVDSVAVSRAAKKFANEYGLRDRSDVEMLTGQLLDLYRRMASGENYDVYSAEAERIAESIAQRASDDYMYMEYGELRRQIRETVITVTDSESHEIPDFRDVKKQLRGRARIKIGRTNIDTVFQNLAQNYPELFNENTHNNPGDQLRRILEVVDILYTPGGKLFDQNSMDMAVQIIRDEILHEFLSTEAAPTAADRQAEKADKAKNNALEQAYAKKDRELGDAVAALSRQAQEFANRAAERGRLEGLLAGQMSQGRFMAKQASTLEERLKNAKEVIRSLRQQISEAEKKGRADQRSIERLNRNLSMQESAIDASRKRLAEYREGRNERDAVAKGRLSVEKKAKALAKMLTTNTDKSHVPEDLKDAVGQLLQSLDFSSRQFQKRGEQTYRDMDYDAMMTKVRNALAAHSKFEGEAEAWMDLPDGFLESIQKHIDTVKDSVRGISDMQTNQVYRMNSAQLSDLAHILTVVKTSLENINSFYAQGRAQTVKQAADSTIRYTRKHGSASGNPNGWLRRQLEWYNTVPIYAFSRFGEGGEQCFQGMQDGWDKLSFNVRKVLDFKKGVFTDQEAREWGKQLHNVTLESGDVVTMSTAQIMSLVCLSKRAQAVQHMMQGGIRIANIQVDGKLGKSDTLRQAANYNLTLTDLNNIGNLLTDKQKSVATEIQKFMEEQGSEWGNEVSMRRFGYRAFTESNYFPIASDPTNLPAVDPEARKNDMFRLMHLSATKATMEKANNAIVISNIFEVFGDHMADMAKYNALTLPILDMMKWYNYVDRVEGVNGQFTTRSVQRSILDAYGEGAGNYITTFIKDLNGVHEFGRGEGFMSKFVSNYKAAAVGANLRVAILQPTAYSRAWAVMEAGYLRRGLKMSARKGAAEMERYSGIGNWKSMGFYDTNVNRGIRQQLSGEGTAMDTVRDKSMAAAELMDKLTWGALWNACKLETMEKQGLSGEELMQATAIRFREIVYKTQVVDSTMTRSHNMRGGSIMKFATAFMSEPTLSYNLVMDAYMNFRDAQRSGTNLEKGNARKRMVRSFAAYASSALAGAIMESLADALRDDDDYESYLRKFWEAFWGWDGNLVSDIRISNKIPFFKDIASIFGGNTVDRMDLASFKDLKEAWDIWKETVELATGKLDKPTSVTYYGNMTTYGKIYKALRAISGLSGIPLASSTREVITLWNNTAGILYPDLKVKTYNAGDEKEILNALEDGHITADAAVQLLTEKVKDEKTGEPMSADDAYWKVKQIVTGYGKTGELEAALESGDEQHIQDCVDEMLSHGYEQKDIPGKITSAIRELYTKDADGNTGEGRISREQAQNLLREFAGKEEKDIFWNLQVWDQIRDGVEDAGVYRDLYNAVSTGKNLESTVKFYLDNGMGKDTLSQRLSDEFRETYTGMHQTDRSAADTMKRNLLDAYEALGYDRQEKAAVIAGWVYDGKLSEALESGNDKSIQSTIKSMVADGYDEQDVPGKVSSLVKALYTKDSNGELGSGRITRETAKKLLTTYADMDETDVFWTLRDWDRIAAGETNVNRYDDLHQAVSTGKSIQQTVKFYLDNGIGKSTLSQNLTSTYKQQYIDLYYSDPKAASALKKRLLDAYVAMGYDRSKKAKVIDGWIADAKD